MDESEVDLGPLDSPVELQRNVTLSDPLSFNDSISSDINEDIHATERPLQIGVIISGNWRTTKIPLEYLILSLNSRQTLFEYQLISLEQYKERMTYFLSRGSNQDKLLNSILNGSEISIGKLDMKHWVNDIACILKNEIERRSDIFDKEHNPTHFIFITTSEHSDPNFFQEDGSNGFCKGDPCRGGIIMTGHHKSKMAPPTVIEFIFKFLFRISIKFKFVEFTRKHRHFGQKSCLFDFNNDISLTRYLVLHNFICYGCRKKLGDKIANQILCALDPEKLYGTSVERHPAKISSKLGFNLSLVKGMYKTRYEQIQESISNSFFSRLGSLVALSMVVGGFYASGLERWFLNED